jgi:hypothetical protein
MRAGLGVFAVVLALACVGCAPGSSVGTSPRTSSVTSTLRPARVPSADASATAIAQRFGLHITGAATTVDAVIPRDLGEGWKVACEAASAGGYRLRSCAGARVRASTYLLSDLYWPPQEHSARFQQVDPYSLTLVLVEANGSCVGAFVVAGGKDAAATPAPGVFAANDPHIRAAASGQ